MPLCKVNVTLPQISEQLNLTCSVICELYNRKKITSLFNLLIKIALQLEISLHLIALRYAIALNCCLFVCPSVHRSLALRCTDMKLTKIHFCPWLHKLGLKKVLLGF